jgi:glycosyltransferase involved in cell wall biosynthesis
MVNKRDIQHVGPELSLIVTMYNEGKSCQAFFAAVVPVLSKITGDYEIICVNDGSTDDTLFILKQMCEADSRIKLISFTRNFGKELALTAGLDYASGMAVIPIDADLQDPPELIPELVAKWRDGFDVVLAQRSDRASDSLLKRVTARGFYAVANIVNETPIPADTGDFRLMDRRVVEALRRFPERTRFMKGLFAWLGFSQTTIPYVRAARAAGQSKWRYWRLWNFALEGIFSFSTLPLRLWMYLGLLVGLFSGAYILFILTRVLLFGVDVPGYASIIVAILFFSGINMIGLGIIGEYLGRVLSEVKRRPLYLIDEAVGLGVGEGVALHPAVHDRDRVSKRRHRVKRNSLRPAALVAGTSNPSGPATQ